MSNSYDVIIDPKKKKKKEQESKTKESNWIKVKALMVVCSLTLLKQFFVSYQIFWHQQINTIELKKKI